MNTLTVEFVPRVRERAADELALMSDSDGAWMLNCDGVCIGSMVGGEIISADSSYVPRWRWTGAESFAADVRANPPKALRCAFELMELATHLMDEAYRCSARDKAMALKDLARVDELLTAAKAWRNLCGLEEPAEP